MKRQWGNRRNSMPKQSGQTITKTVVQYSKSLSRETLDFLMDIARDYAKVKNAVYERYCGIKSVNKLASSYEIMNEMRYCGLRAQLNLPTVYYEAAILEAVSDLKSNWTFIKSKIISEINAREDLAEAEKIYIRTVLRNNIIYELILCNKPHEAIRNATEAESNEKKLDNLLRRLTRKYHMRPHAKSQHSFTITPNGYSYKNGDLKIACRTPRKRVVIPMRDDREFDRQLIIRIVDDHIELTAPVETRIKRHCDYVNVIFAYIGYTDMLTLSNGNIYGERLGESVTSETERLYKANRQRMVEAKAQNINVTELGNKKYLAQKKKARSKTTAFINTEVNRMIETEKPKKIVTTRPITVNPQKIYSQYLNRKFSRSFDNYVRERMRYKCQLHDIELVEISSKGTGSICSECGAEGKRLKGIFECQKCGLRTSIPLNSARNIERIYKNGLGIKSGN